MRMNIRKVRSTDYDNIYELVKVAFETALVSDGTKQDFVLKLRSGEGYISEFERVAEKNGDFEALLLAPICVKLNYRNEGISSMLIKESLKLAQDKGYTASCLL